ncbi:CitMHS family citrate-Mg2+:H+ or citrate-Ca2+:H+ symporter [Microbacterium sp. SORGH_AS 1204]|uniref:CitMHS family transporter n=1 Tax=Microbacterium sp. SORGH_AS_1204 TaxID=3041785 RepID=UPI00278FE67D|nr:SLC13 family permease [Microbacterium sp. SORGH_AS_1204]MDQ1135413.1 CitMHS family citrate-Mg2+:H+ or citrate-Ca2+:H+ symporter [Microbacterium sp. SORGH_AS_1204]
MLVVLGFAMIAVFMTLVMTKRATPIATLILVPIIFGLFTGAGLGLSDMIIESFLKLAPTAGLLFFATMFFGTMIDVGLFDPLIRLILRFVGDHPTRLVVGTALLTSIVSLDGDGSTTFIIVTSAFLPIYLRLGMSPVILTVVAAMSNGVLNTVPWGGSTARAAAALNVSPIDIFVPMIPSIAAGVGAVLVLAYLMGRSETKRLGRLELTESPGFLRKADVVGEEIRSGSSRLFRGGTAQEGGTPKWNSSVVVTNNFAVPVDDEGRNILDRPNARPKLIWFNLVLTLAVMTVLVMDITEPVVIFLVAAALALVVNFPRIQEQSAQIKAHASSIVSVVGMVFAASVLTGVMNGTGMVEAMAGWLVSVIPSALGPFMAVIAGILSIPLTFIMTNDAFYFGVLPILAETAGHYGITPVEMARASLVGQALHQSSPLVASFLLLIGLANVNLGEHFRKVIWRGAIVALIMLAVGGFIAYPLF